MTTIIIDLISFSCLTWVLSPIAQQLHSVCARAQNGRYGNCNTTQPCGGTTHSNERWVLTPAGQLRTSIAATSTPCATLQADKTVVLEACQTPVPSTQHWTYAATTKQLTAGGGLCVTAPSSSGALKPTTLIVGRPLSSPPPGHAASAWNTSAALRVGKRGYSYALLFLNNKHNATTLACDAACLGRLNVPVGAAFTVTNVITGAPHPPKPELTVGSGGSDGHIMANVPAFGASVFLRLDPK